MIQNLCSRSAGIIICIAPPAEITKQITTAIAHKISTECETQVFAGQYEYCTSDNKPVGPNTNEHRMRALFFMGPQMRIEGIGLTVAASVCLKAFSWEFGISAALGIGLFMCVN